MDSFQNPPQKPRRRFDKTIWILLISFIAFGSLTAYLAFSIVKEEVASLWKAPATPEIDTSSPPLIDQELFLDVDTPLQTGDGPPPVPWDGNSPVTMVLLGVDSRDWKTDNGPPLADTIIIATLDPQAKTAAMLSIPRDLWVDIPGYGNHKVNQAYRLGEANHLPEGGAGLVIDTIEKLFETSIPYYALIDFNAFVTIIDQIDGVKIDVPEKIKIDPLGDHNTEILKPGVQTLSGELALAYVRNRDTAGSDFDRIKRQQQVILGIQKRLISFQMIPILINRAPDIYEEIKSGIKTNLTLQQVVQFGWLTAQIPEGNIRSYSIKPEQVIDTYSYDGMAILMPIAEEMYAIRDEFLNIEQPASPETVVEMTLDDRTEVEKAAVIIKNGTLTAGLAARTQEFLESKGIYVIDVANAEQTYKQTTIIDYAGKPYTVNFLSELLNISPDKIYQRFEPDNEAEVVVILGEDWAENNNMP